MKKLVNHPEIKKYQKKMKQMDRCFQCVFPWHDGFCECDKSGNEQETIATLACKLRKEGWKT